MVDNNSSNTRFQWIFLTLLTGFIGMVAGVTMWFVMQQGQNQATSDSLLVLPEPRTIADFNLVDHRGQAFTLEALRGHWSLIFFGFTHCPDVCPNTLYNLKWVDERLGELRAGKQPGHQVVFVSVDPERDTPGLISQYVSYFDPEFIGATGVDAQLAALTLQLGIAYRIEEHEPGSQKYDVMHSAGILLTDPRGRLYGVFPAPHDAQAMASDLAALID